MKRAGVTVELLRKIEPQAYNCMNMTFHSHPSSPIKEGECQERVFLIHDNISNSEMEVFTPIQGVDYNVCDSEERSSP